MTDLAAAVLEALGSSFARDDLGRAVVHRPAVIKRAVLPDADRLLRMIDARRASHPHVRVFRDGIPADPTTYSRTDRTRRAIASVAVPSRLAAAVADGAVLAVDHVEHSDADVRALAVALQRRLDARIQVNAYLSRGGESGFAPHWDDHDVLVVHCTGTRRWTLWTGGRPAPLHDDIEHETDPPGEPTREIGLGPGDLLYLPRGTWHAVDRADPAGDAASLHLTVGVHRLTGVDWLQWATAELLDEEIVRSDLPVHADSAEQAAHLSRLAATVAGRLSDLGQTALARVDAEIRGRADLLEPARPGSLLLPGDRAVSRVPYPVQVDLIDGRARFVAADRVWWIPASVADDARRLLNAPAESPEPIPADGPVAELASDLAGAGLIECW